MSRARDFADLAGSADAGGLTGRNLIINGAMQVAQRGTSFSSISGSTYTLDRFAVRNATSVSQSTDVPSGEGFKNSLFYDNDGTRTAINIRQPIEDVVRLAEGKSLTLSFWMKASVATTISVDFTDKANTNVSVTTSWAEYKVTLSSLTGLNPSDFYEAGAGWLDFNLGSDYPDVYLTGVQLEVGDKATPFEHRSFGEELALCQRYYHQLVDGNNQAIGQGSYYNSGIWQVHVDFPTTMRATPDLIITAAADHYNITSGNANDSIDGDDNIQSASTRACFLQFTTNVSGTQGNGGHVHSARSTSSVAFDAEL